MGILTLLISILIYGYYPVRDTLLAYPTKVLYSGQWVMSQYGNPPIKIETPDVLERIKTDREVIFNSLQWGHSIVLLYRLTI